MAQQDGSVDKSANGYGYVDATYLDAAAAWLQPVKKRSYDLQALEPGASVLDVGCGPAIDTIALGRIVTERGRVVGVDADSEMVAEANARTMREGLAGVVTHQQAVASDLPFADSTFDGCRAERLFQHLSDAPAALAEMVRVTRPGGRVIVVDTDWAAAFSDIPDPEIADIWDRLHTFAVSALLANAYAGRRLYRQFREAGLRELVVEPWTMPITSLDLLRYVATIDMIEAEGVAAGAVTAGDIDRWRQALEDADANGTLFACGTMMLASGTKA